MKAEGSLTHLLDVPGGIGLAHRSFRDPVRGICTGFTVIQPSSELGRRVPAGVAVLNGAGELTGAHQIREWGYLETPIVLTNTVSVGRAYDVVSRWMMERLPAIGEKRDVVIPVVGECDDSLLSDPRARAWEDRDLVAALDEALARAAGAAPPAPAEALALGSVGAGTGTIAFDLKAGIGSASRKAGSFTVGVLVQANFGARHQLRIGQVTGEWQLPPPSAHREGSCIGLVATDAPLGAAALGRLASRMGLGLARCGAVAHHGSGEIFLAFSTSTNAPAIEPLRMDSEEWNPLFEAVVEATEEAVIRALREARPERNSRVSVPALRDAEDSRPLR